MLKRVEHDIIKQFTALLRSELLNSEPRRSTHLVPINETLTLRVSDSCFRLPFGGRQCIGVDPGKHYGIAAWDGDELHLMYVMLEPVQGGHKYLYTAYEVTRFLIRQFAPKIAVIEGASHNESYGQDVLSQIRGVIDVAFEVNGVEVAQVPPLLLRKIVWGSGKTDPTTLFPHLNPHAINALSCLVYGVGVV